jgi:hypothetical protein
MKLKTIFFVTIGLLALAALTSWWGGRAPKASTADPLVGEPLVSADDLRNLVALEIRSGAGETLRLEQSSDGRWMVASEAGVPADLDRLRRTVQPLLQGRLARFVTARPERKEGLDLSRQTLRLEGPGGEEILAVKIGRVASAGGVYVEPGESGRVYRLDESLSLDTSAASWIDRTPVRFQPEDIRTVSVGFSPESGAAPLRFTRESATADWSVEGAPEGTSIKVADLNRLLRNLGSLRMNRHVGRDDPAAIEAEAFQRTFRFETFDGADFSVSLGRRPEGVASADWMEQLPVVDSLFPEGEGASASDKDPEEPPPAGTPFAQVAFTRGEAPWAAVADQFAFEIAEWTFNQLPATPEALLDLPQAPPPPAEAPSPEAGDDAVEPTADS